MLCFVADEVLQAFLIASAAYDTSTTAVGDVWLRGADWLQFISPVKWYF